MRANTNVEKTNDVVMRIEKQTRDLGTVGDVQCKNTQRISLLEGDAAARTLAAKHNDNIIAALQEKLTRYVYQRCRS